jgi:hypothetical protein
MREYLERDVIEARSHIRSMLRYIDRILPCRFDFVTAHSYLGIESRLEAVQGGCVYLIIYIHRIAIIDGYQEQFVSLATLQILEQAISSGNVIEPFKTADVFQKPMNHATPPLATDR